MRTVLIAALLLLLSTMALAQTELDMGDFDDSSNDTELDDGMPSEIQLEGEELLLNFKDVMAGSTLIEFLPSLSDEEIMRMGNDSKCLDCVSCAAKKVLEHVLAHIKRVCDRTKCPHIKKHCEWMAKHPKFALGQLIYHVRPHSLGFSYCIGAGKCKHHDNGQVLEKLPSEDDLIRGEYLLELIERNQSVSEVLALRLEQQDSDTIELQLEELVPEDADAEYPTDDSCKKCIHWVSAAVVKRHVERFVKLCKTTKNPVIKAHCKWVKSHFSVWLGMSTASLRPEEFACGFCVGKEACPADYRHQHSPEELN